MNFKKIRVLDPLEATVRRIAAPARSSTRGASKLAGAELESYRRKLWVPKLGQATDSSRKGTYKLRI